MGGLRKIMPTTYWTFVIASLAISGIPPLAGFMSKDEILFSTFNSTHPGIAPMLLWTVGVITAFMTAFYMFRLVYLTFHGESRMDPEVEAHAHESPPVITVPLTTLAVLSTFGGFLGIPIFMKYNVMHNFLGPLFEAVGHGEEAGHAVHHSLSTELGLMAVSVVVAVAGILLALNIILKRPQVAEGIKNSFSFLYNLSLNKWWVDELYDMVIVRPLNRIGNIFWTEFDGKGIDGTLHGIANGARGSGGFLSKLQTGFVQNYALSMAGGLVLILLWILF
jgi:NADH-quinone oxidoreductase subunit L